MGGEEVSLLLEGDGVVDRSGKRFSFWDLKSSLVELSFFAVFWSDDGGLLKFSSAALRRFLLLSLGYQREKKLQSLQIFLIR